MSDYADISLLECNRKQSTQNETTANNSLWTNRMGEVIELDIGDELSIEAGFINQRGCANPYSIEFKGKSLGVNGVFNYSQDYDSRTPEISSFNNPTSETNESQLSSTLFRFKTNQDKEIELKDNEVNIEVSYYKNMNGEQHVFLPRKFLPDQVGTEGGYTNIADLKQIFTSTDYEMDSQKVGSADNYVGGANSGQVDCFPISFNLPYGEFNPKRGIEMKYFNPNDYGLFCKGTSVAGQTFVSPILASGLEPGIGGFKVLEVRPFIDNSKYTLFTLDFYFQQYNGDISAPIYYMKSHPDIHGVPQPDTEEIKNITAINYWTSNYGTDTEVSKVLRKYTLLDTTPDPNDGTKYYVNSPALSQYSRHIDLITLKLKKGFNSPQSIAEQLTQQLQEERKDSPEIFNKAGQHGGTTPLSYVVKSKTFKTYDSANYGDFTNAKAEAFLSDATANQDSFEYYRNYQNIFVKRPDLFEAGRKCNTPRGNVGFYDGDKYYTHTEFSGFDLSKYGKPNYIKNYIGDQLLEDGTTRFGNYTDSIITSWVWNAENLNNLRNLFKVQGRYPELFKNVKTNNASDGEIWNNETFTGDISGTTTPIPAPTHPTIDNARFLHMNRFNYDEVNYNYLGNDGYTMPNYQGGDSDPQNYFIADHRSLPIFFKYQPENQDKYIEEPDINNLCYGFATKHRVLSNPPALNTDDRYYIEIHPEAPHSQGIHNDFFKLRGGAPEDSAAFVPQSIAAETTLIGWDYSFNSWGNVVSLGFTGIPLASYANEFHAGIGTNFNDTETTESTADQKYVRSIKSAVIGANNPACVYDAVSGKFGFSDLHIPEKIGQQFDAGQTRTIDGSVPATSTTIPIIADASNVCYKINKRTRASSYCPDLNGTQFSELGNTQEINAQKNNIMTFSFFNSRISPYTIFDSHMGVNLNLGNTFKISDSNKQPEIWDNGLMGLIGFTYEQFNPKTKTTANIGSSRVDFRNIESIFNPTTNSQVLNTDIQDFTMNPYGGVQYSPIISTPLLIKDFSHAEGTHIGSPIPNVSYFPPIVQDTHSIKIEGLKLPKLVQRPYLTIRSDIISNNKYIGGKNSGLSLPVISVINKINADKDFIQVSDTQFNYTITQPTKFSEITTAITNPDGSLADTEDGNAIIYKIRKRGDLTNFDILAQILQEQSKKGKKDKKYG